MSEPIQLMVVDLSHYDPAENYEAVKAAGVVGVIYKATQGSGYQDPTYMENRDRAKKAGLLWGSYHFGDGSDVSDQVSNYIENTKIEDDELFCLDFEENEDNTMDLEGAKLFVEMVEVDLDRMEECVLYSGNVIKETLGDQADVFWSKRRLWLAQYSSVPEVPAAWDEYWLWQYTDGQCGPKPWTVDGCDQGGVDCNSYLGTAEELAAEWASGISVRPPAIPPVIVSIVAPPGVSVQIITTGDVEVSDAD